MLSNQKRIREYVVSANVELSRLTSHGRRGSVLVVRRLDYIHHVHDAKYEMVSGSFLRWDAAGRM